MKSTTSRTAAAPRPKPFGISVKLSRINTGLLVAIILVNAYIILLPVVPGLLFQLQKRNPARMQHLEHVIHSPTAKPAAPQPNQLIVPSMAFDEPIYEGPTLTTLRKGLWRLPIGSTPDKGGNTVIAGHRFTYTNPRGVLYNLNQVKIGDDMGVIWNNKKYVYKVTNIQQVPPNDTAVEALSTTSELTVYTCTPLWLPKDRLVVTAVLEAAP